MRRCKVFLRGDNILIVRPGRISRFPIAGLLFFIVLVSCVFGAIVWHNTLVKVGSEEYGWLFHEEYKPVMHHTVGDFDKADCNVRYLLSTGQSELTMYVGNLSNRLDFDRYLDMYGDVLQQYPEFLYDSVSLMGYGNTAILKLRNSSYDRGMREQRIDTCIEIAQQVHDAMRGSGQITSYSSDVDKARAYYDWLIDNCEYDMVAYENSKLKNRLDKVPVEFRDSYTVYGALVNHKAVCAGYAAAYNLLLRTEGIECIVVHSDNHAWTEARLDGTVVDIDATWGIPHYSMINISA